MNTLQTIFKKSINISVRNLYQTIRVPITELIDKQVLKDANIKMIIIEISYDNITQDYESYALITPKTKLNLLPNTEESDIKYYTEMTNKLAFKN